MLADLHERLAGVVIERLPYADLIRRYDGPEVLFYLDPPHWGCEADYGAGASGRPDFERLATQLARIAGSFILSINDTPGAREVFGQFDIEAVETTYTISTATSGAAGAGGRVDRAGLIGAGDVAAHRGRPRHPNDETRRWLAPRRVQRRFNPFFNP